MRTFLCLLLALPIALLLASSVRAEGVTFPDLAENVPGTTGVTYLDLVRLVVPDIALVGDIYQGHKSIDVRHIGGDEMDSEPPATIELKPLAVLPVQSDGKDRLLLLIDFGQSEDSVESYSVLALFSIVDHPELVDAAAVGYDRDTFFRYPDSLSLGEGKHAVLTLSTHFNSNQTYVTSAAILIRNDRLQLIDTFFTFHDRACSFVRDEELDLRAGDRDARTYSDIVVTVTETTKLTGEDCGDEQSPKAGTRKATATYRWDEAVSRFVPDSDAIKKIEKENMERL